jgi:plasmid stabilization system protein ParE
LEQIGDSIAIQLQSSQAALNTINKIQDKIDALADFPLIGAQLSSIYDIATDYRFLVCGRYLAFYRPQDTVVLIDRILYGRRDYLAILFGNLPQDETE